MATPLQGFDDLTSEVIRDAERIIRPHLSATPQIRWPLLESACGNHLAIWTKHENHLPTGAFKIRGGLCYLDWLSRNHPDVTTVVAATRGNHGQSIAFAARVCGLGCRIVVPRGNSPEKNAAMKAYGAELIEHGTDFQAALEFAEGLVNDTPHSHFVPSFDWRLVSGIATAGWEFLQAVPDLDTLYVPIGLGSGICGAAAARRALGRGRFPRLVGVIAAAAPAYELSFTAGRVISTEGVPQTLADGVACRVPHEEALKTILNEVDRIVTVSENDLKRALKIHLKATHQLAEGAAALPLAALFQEVEEGQERVGTRIGLMQSGGNLDTAVLHRVLGD